MAVNTFTGFKPDMVWIKQRKEMRMIQMEIDKVDNGFVMELTTPAGTQRFIMKELSEAGDMLSVALATLRLEDKLTVPENKTATEMAMKQQFMNDVARRMSHQLDANAYAALNPSIMYTEGNGESK